MRCVFPVIMVVALGSACGGDGGNVEPTPPPPEPAGREWSFTNKPDPITGEPILHAFLLADESSDPGLSLSVRCKRDAGLDVYVTGEVITEDGDVRYRLDAEPPQTEVWNESTDFRTLFFPGNPHTFSQRLAAGNKLAFEYRQYVGGLINGTFSVRGLGAHLPALFGECPAG